MASATSTMTPLGLQAPAFSLLNTHPDIDGAEISLQDYQGKSILIAFWCNHCPFVVHIRDRFIDFARQQISQGLAIVAISANDAVAYPADSPSCMTTEAQQHSYPFPYLYDESQSTARAYKAVCTPDFFLYDSHHQLCYRGRFDASTPGNGQPITGDELTYASKAVLSDQPASALQNPGIGCSIKWK